MARLVEVKSVSLKENLGGKEEEQLRDQKRKQRKTNKNNKKERATRTCRGSSNQHSM